MKNNSWRVEKEQRKGNTQINAQHIIARALSRRSSMRQIFYASCEHFALFFLMTDEWRPNVCCCATELQPLKFNVLFIISIWHFLCCVCVWRGYSQARIGACVICFVFFLCCGLEQVKEFQFGVPVFTICGCGGCRRTHDQSYTR